MSYGGYGAALQAVGGVLQAVAAQQAGEKMRQEFLNELARQQHLGQQSYETWQTGTRGRGVEDARSQMAQGKAQRENLYSELDSASMDAGGSKADSRDKQHMKSSGSARAQLGSYSDWELMQHINNIRTQNEMNKLSNFSQGWERVFPFRMDDASHSQDELKLTGSLLSSVGGGAGDFSNIYSGEGGTKNVTMYAPKNPPGVSGGYDYNVPPSIGTDGNPYNPYSIYA